MKLNNHLEFLYCSVNRIFCTILIILFFSFFASGNPRFSTTKGFIENKGQIISTKGQLCPEILFKSSHKGLDIYLRNNGISYVFAKIENRDSLLESKDPYDSQSKGKILPKISLFRMDMVLKNSNSNCSIEKEFNSFESINYFFPHCPNGIHDVKKWRKIIYRDIYPKIDWIIYFSEENDQLKYDFVVHPGGNPNNIEIDYKNSDDMKLYTNNIIEISSKLGAVKDGELVCFQGENLIKSKFEIRNRRIGFEIGTYDKTKILTIDPYLTWSTYFGGGLDEQNASIKVDNDDNVIVSGHTLSTNFPTLGYSSGYNDSSSNGNYDIYLSKFNNSGQQIWTTYYGGSQNDYPIGFYGNHLTVDSLSSIYLTGHTYSSNFPLQSISGAFFQNTLNGPSDLIILKFLKDGSRAYATLMGGNSDEFGSGIKVNSDGEVFILGNSSSNNFPTLTSTGAYSQNSLFNFTGIIVRFNSNFKLKWSTYFGGSWGAVTSDIAFDSVNNFYVSGAAQYWSGTNLPVKDMGNGAFYVSANTTGYYDGFLTKFMNDGSLKWCTWVGGGGNGTAANDGIHHIEINKSTKSLFAVAEGSAINYPLKSISGSYFKGTITDDRDIAILEFSLSGKLLWSTYFGGTDVVALSEVPTGLTFDKNNNIIVAGLTTANDFPVKNDNTYFKATKSGGKELVFLGFNPQKQLLFSTYFGGSGDESANSSNNICADKYGSFFYSGYTNSTCSTLSSGFPLFNPGNGAYYQGNISGGFDSYILKFSPKPVAGTGNICSIPVQTICTISSNISTNSPICFGNTLNFTPTNSTASGYYWNGPNGFTSTSTSVSIPNATSSISGTYKLTISSPGCIDLIKTVSGTVFPDVSSAITVSGFKNSYCSNDPPATISGFPTGGIWKGKGISGNQYRPSLVGSGRDTVTYILFRNGCTGTSVNFIDVIQSPLATIYGLNTTYCLDAPPVTISSIDPGGSFQGKGINGNIFTPSTAGIGIDSIIYTVKINGCTNSFQRLVQINPIPIASILGLNKNYCIYDSPVTLTGLQSGGIWKGKGIVGTSFTPQTAGIGRDTVTYISSSLGCTNTTTSIVQVFPSPSITISGLLTNYCINGASTPIAALPAGGQWKGRGISFNTYFPAQAGIRKDTVTYSTSLNGCSSTTTSFVQVYPTPTASIIGLSSYYCSNSITTTISGIPFGGTFLGSSVNGNTYSPQLSAIGLDSIKYVVSVNGCTNTTTSITTIYPFTSFSISGLSSRYCFNSPTITLTGSPLGGIWKGNGILGNFLIVSLAGVGFDTISYTPSNKVCSIGNSKTIEIKPLPSINLSGLSSEYCADHQGVIFSYSPENSTIAGKGINGNYFTPKSADIGINTITISAILNGCYLQKEYSVNIQKVDSAKIVGLSPYYCKSDPPAYLTGYPSGGIFSSNVKSNLYYPSLAIFNTDTVNYYFTSYYPCLIPAKKGTYISSSPTVTFTGLNNLVCQDNQTVTLTGVPSGGSFFGKGILNNTFSSQLAGEGWHKIGYFFTNSYGCSDTSYGGSYVEYLLELPNIFTPNGDGKNDTLVIKGLQSEAQIEVTNRWGNVVYQNKNYKNDWEAEGIADGIYFYRITNNGQCKPESSGWLQITR